MFVTWNRVIPFVLEPVPLYVTVKFWIVTFPAVTLMTVPSAKAEAFCQTVGSFVTLLVNVIGVLIVIDSL